MIIRLLLVFLLLPGIKAWAQQRFIDFNSSIPANLSSTVNNQYPLSDEHMKGGAKSLKWTPSNNATVSIHFQNIPPGEKGKTTSGLVQFFISTATR